jgi:hypothetical protein
MSRAPLDAILGFTRPSPQLREIEPNIPELPPKKAIGNTKPQFLQERKKALNFYLQVCFHLLLTVQVLVAETHLTSTELCLPVGEGAKYTADAEP